VTNLVIHPTREEFAARASGTNVVPVWAEIWADTDTPVSVYQKLAWGRPGFLLESVEGPQRWARYSFIGVDPFLTLTTTRTGSVAVAPGQKERNIAEKNPILALRHILHGYRPAQGPEGLPFWGGAVGYIGFDAIRTWEPVGWPERISPEAELARFMFCSTVVAHDQFAHRALVIHNQVVDGDPAPAYDQAVAAIGRVTAKLAGPVPDQGRLPPPALLTGSPPPAAAPFTGNGSALTSDMDEDTFQAAVRRAKEHIAAGDIYQVVLAQQFQRPARANALDIYRVLRVTNPSPYMFLLDFGDRQLVGASPEMLVRVRGDYVETRPIAGTRPRGASEPEDVALESALLADPKEQAEHFMLVDLARNDLGRVAAYGTVEVPRVMYVERFSHVMHLVSDVRARLAAGQTALDALMAAHPAGTVSGAPKIRAIQIIDSLEKSPRGPYGGAVGYVGFDGNLDTCITIRTAVLERGRAYIGAGAGIVADSDPAREYMETVNKARAVVRAVELAERGVDEDDAGADYR